MRVQEGVSSGKSSRAKGGAHLFLDRQLDAQPFRMRLGPDETGIDESDFGEALEFPEADCEQFARLEFAAGPLSRRREVALAASAKVDGRLLRDALGDVDAVGSRQERKRSGQQIATGVMQFTTTHEFRRQLTQRLAPLGWIGVPQSARARVSNAG